MTVADVLPAALRDAVSPYTGIVRSLEECLQATGDPPLFRFACEVGRGSALLGSPLDHLAGLGGAGLTRCGAASACVGEALERYSAAYVQRDRIVVVSASELGDAAVAPERFALFSERQLRQERFPFRRFTRDTRVAWVAGRALPDGAEAWLPAELVFLSDVVESGEPRVAYATSSGLACAPTLDAALVRCLCELLERDAFMIAWAGRLSLPLLDWAEDETVSELDARLFAPLGLGYAAVDLSAFHQLPSVLGVVRAPHGRAGALGVGAGTAPTVEQAWRKALSEAAAARAAGPKLALVDDRDLGRHGLRVASFEDHIRYYSDRSRAEAASFLDASIERTPTALVPLLEGDTPADHVEALCARVETAGSSAYWVDVTSPDVASLGLVVARVVAPELCMLDVVHSARFLGGERLYGGAATLGLRRGRLEERDVNPDPHPFP
jgi:ribosomal protein S12 methylthiotransferase accessory factor